MKINYYKNILQDVMHTLRLCKQAGSASERLSKLFQISNMTGDAGHMTGAPEEHIQGDNWCADTFKTRHSWSWPT